ncbi:MAG TPA: hypothetical protein VHO69_06995, partial [Phototrophicaceae bacterium]|nr:hypothetical protein [Phototrophicaceae bacterium]
QIWRYEPSGGTYATPPNEYFAGVNRPDIRATVDFGIDDKGNLYVLSNSGQIHKYRSGEEIEFAYANFPSDPPMPGADALFLNNDPTAQGLFIVCRANRTIYETSLAGTFNASYRAFNEADFTLISNVVADASQGREYTSAPARYSLTPGSPNAPLHKAARLHRSGENAANRLPAALYCPTP